MQLSKYFIGCTNIEKIGDRFVEPQQAKDTGLKLQCLAWLVLAKMTLKG